MTRTHTNTFKWIPAQLPGRGARFVTPASGAMNAATSALAKGYVR
jgi:surfactin synthase thioesterase subunit